MDRRIHLSYPELDVKNVDIVSGFGLVRPRFAVLGCDFAGQVEAVGASATTFGIGDQVFGTIAPRFGAHAEYLCIPENGAVAAMPAGLRYPEAAALVDATALSFLRDHAHLRGGQTIAINGASGAVGVAGKSSFGRCRRALTDRGIYLTTAPSPAILIAMPWRSRFAAKKAAVAFTGLRSAAEKRADLLYLAGLADASQIAPVVDSCYPLDRIAEAHRRVEAGHKHGNVIVTME